MMTNSLALNAELLSLLNRTGDVGDLPQPFAREIVLLECRVRRGRRRLELAQSYLNRNERLPLTSIESTLDDEFRRWQAKIEEIRRSLEDAHAFE